MSCEGSSGNTDPMQSGEDQQARRRRINQAFRDGDLEQCLREIVAGLAQEPDEPHLLKALTVVQGRYLYEVITPLVDEGKIDEAAHGMSTLERSGHLTPETEKLLSTLKSRIDGARSPQKEVPPTAVKTAEDNGLSEELDVSEKALGKAEKAWAEGRKKEAKQLLKTLSLLPLDDHDLDLRRESLRRLVEHDERRVSVSTERDLSAWRWVLVLMLIVPVVVIAVLMLREGGIWGLDFRAITGVLDRRDIGSEIETELPRRDGWVVIEAGGTAGDIRDSTGLTVGALGKFISLPSGTAALKIEAPGFVDTVLSVVLVAGDTLSIPIELRSLRPPDGLLQLQTTPAGAIVMLDGRKEDGVTPMGPLSMPPGRYEIRFEMEGRVPEMREAVVTSGATTVVEASLPEWHTHGRFQLNSRPWSYVFVDGDSIGPTPVTTAELKTDIDHALLFRTETGLKIQKVMKLHPGRAEPTPLTVQFPSPGRLAIATVDSVTGKPVSARVWANGRLIGNSFEEFDLSPGTVTLRFEKAGYSPAESTLTIHEGSRTELTLTLVPEGS